MKCHITAVGRPRGTWAKEALEHYQKFLRKYGGIDFHFVSGVRIKGNTNNERVRAIETERLIAATPERAKCIFVDRTGRAFDSEKWARHLARVMQISAGPVAFLVGGPLGLDLAKKRPTDEIWSLSSLTFPHELALIVLCEQLARGLSILHGDSYHN